MTATPAVRCTSCVWKNQQGRPCIPCPEPALRARAAEMTACRERLGRLFDPVLDEHPHLAAHIDGIAMELRVGLARCGIDPANREVLDALVLYAETFAAAQLRHAPFDAPDVGPRMWAGTAQLTAAVLVLDKELAHTRGDT